MTAGSGGSDSELSGFSASDSTSGVGSGSPLNEQGRIMKSVLFSNDFSSDSGGVSGATTKKIIMEF